MIALRNLLMAAMVASPFNCGVADGATTAEDQRLCQDGWTIDRVTVSGTERPGICHLVVSGRFAIAAAAVWQEIAHQYETGWGTTEYANGDTTMARYKIPIPVLRDRRYRLRIVNHCAMMREDFQEVPGYGNVRSIRGSWQVVPISGSVTRVDYDLETDPGVKLVPGFVIGWATKRVIPSVYERIYKEALNLVAK